ncbi:hypothetical protein ALC60_06001 [Trachymyrmex zeteki]|uniref:Uncharacterized protein n=1 Tax=Mycetomoellerius zeteki TaxID=64791 RepID=A0A151X4E0_9HYME|nr:hypothetical protein ALC60_06001 [Trachymyrmex zeteki]
MVARERPRGAKGSTGGDAERETNKEGGGGARRFRRASEAWPGKAVRHSGSDGGGSEPITYYNCLASERSERGAPVRHPSSRRMASLPITSAVIANFSRPCLLLASRCISRQFVGTSIVFVVCVFYKTTNESYGDTVVMTATEKRCFVGANEVNALLNTHNKAARGGVNNPATPDESNLNCIVKAIYGFSSKRPKLAGYCTAMQDKRCG